MCQWAWVTFFGTLRYCVGLHECSIVAPDRGLTLARAPKIQFFLLPNVEYTIFTDGRDALLPNLTSLVSHTSHGDSVISEKTSGIVFDPWTITALRKETSITLAHKGWIVISSPEDARGELLSIGVCPSGLPDWSFVDYL